MGNRGRKNRKKRVAKSSKVKAKKDNLKIPTSGQFFRLLALQPLSLLVEFENTFELTIQNVNCRFALKPAHADSALQLTHGGTFIAVEFSTNEDNNIFQATQIGLDFIEDFLAALSIVEGVTFKGVLPIQTMIMDQEEKQEYIFMHFLNFHMNHWHKSISKETFRHVHSMLAHWDGLESGKRLRRAARHFQQAIGAEDGLVAFQHAYMGLEAIEKPLANAIGIPHGVIEEEGKCEGCGKKYIKRKNDARWSACICVRSYSSR